MVIRGPKGLNLLKKYENKKESKSLNPKKLPQNVLKRRTTKHLCEWPLRVIIPATGQALQMWNDFCSLPTTALTKIGPVQSVQGLQRRYGSTGICFRSVQSVALCKKGCMVCCRWTASRSPFASRNHHIFRTIPLSMQSVRGAHRRKRIFGTHVLSPLHASSASTGLGNNSSPP